MADYTVKKVGEFPAAVSFNADDVLFAEQSGVARKLSGKLLQEFCKAAIDALVERAETAANDAESAKNAIASLEATAITLDAGQQATAEVAEENGKIIISFGLPKGETGENGNSIKSISRTTGNGAPGTTDTYTVTLTDGSTTTFQVYNGKDGDGAGDMTASVYDPSGKKQDIFAYVDEKTKDIDVDVTADEVTFADGETFQQKYDSGELTGPAGPPGETGPAGADGATGPAGASTIATRTTATLTADGWGAVGVGDYAGMQTITISGVTEDTDFDVDVELSTDSAADTLALEAFSNVTGAYSADGTIDFGCATTIPSVNIPIIIRIYA